MCESLGPAPVHDAPRAVDHECVGDAVHARPLHEPPCLPCLHAQAQAGVTLVKHRKDDVDVFSLILDCFLGVPPPPPSYSSIFGCKEGQKHNKTIMPVQCEAMAALYRDISP